MTVLNCLLHLPGFLLCLPLLLPVRVLLSFSDVDDDHGHPSLCCVMLQEELQSMGQLRAGAGGRRCRFVTRG